MTSSYTSAMSRLLGPMRWLQSSVINEIFHHTPHDICQARGISAGGKLSFGPRLVIAGKSSFDEASFTIEHHLSSTFFILHTTARSNTCFPTPSGTEILRSYEKRLHRCLHVLPCRTVLANFRSPRFSGAISRFTDDRDITPRRDWIISN